ncbi:hypothetical protein NC651_025167 [Populus alba x Populus x berolinensis]|nr:hypothetical protein NC651_025167 [Populus alba x Populus x berolinensis]
MIDYSPHMFAGVEKTRKLAISTACLPGIERGLVSNSILGSGCYNFRWHDGLRKHLLLPEPQGQGFIVFPALKIKLYANILILFFIYELIGEKLLVAIKAVRKAEIDDHSNNPEAYKELIHTALRILIAEKCKESP